ncbi:MAG: 2'-5' RNA ligase family protein [Gemmatimonadota bacterium]
MSSPAEPARQRLFFALWPDSATRSAVARLVDRAAKRCGGRRVPPENLHLTLAFPGAVARAQRTCLEACADRVAGTPFHLVLDRIPGVARSPVA